MCPDFRAVVAGIPAGDCFQRPYWSLLYSGPRSRQEDLFYMKIRRGFIASDHYLKRCLLTVFSELAAVFGRGDISNFGFTKKRKLLTMLDAAIYRARHHVNGRSSEHPYFRPPKPPIRNLTSQTRRLTISISIWMSLLMVRLRS